jgi:hypothetical protein
MISIQIDVDREQVEEAMMDMTSDDLVEMIVSVMERVGAPRLVKSLIGELGDTYAYLEETFGDGAE